MSIGSGGDGFSPRRFLKRLAATMRTFFTALLSVTLLALACVGQTGRDERAEGGGMPRPSIEAVLKAHTDSLMSLPGVVGTAIGECEGKPCIKVLVARKTPELLRRIPEALEGFKVVVSETGEIRALDSARE